jgi:hypothetical protein
LPALRLAGISNQMSNTVLGMMDSTSFLTIRGMLCLWFVVDGGLFKREGAVIPPGNVLERSHVAGS